MRTYSTYTFRQFLADFSDNDACLDYLFDQLYGSLSCYPNYGVVDAGFYRVQGRRYYACIESRYQIHPTIMLLVVVVSNSDVEFAVLSRWFIGEEFALISVAAEASDFEVKMPVVYGSSNVGDWMILVNGMNDGVYTEYDEPAKMNF